MNDDLVYYCKDCGSLGVIQVTKGVCMCKECGSGNISKTKYETWENKYIKKQKDENSRER